MASKRHGLNWIQSQDLPLFSLSRDKIHQGGNSGFQAINLAILFGAKDIRLFGFDMKPNGHFFGLHPPQLKQTEANRFEAWRKALGATVSQIESIGVKIINHTPETALRCFECEPIA